MLYVVELGKKNKPVQKQYEWKRKYQLISINTNQGLKRGLIRCSRTIESFRCVIEANCEGGERMTAHHENTWLPVPGAHMKTSVTGVLQHTVREARWAVFGVSWDSAPEKKCHKTLQVPGLDKKFVHTLPPFYPSAPCTFLNEFLNGYRHTTSKSPGN